MFVMTAIFTYHYFTRKRLEEKFIKILQDWENKQKRLEKVAVMTTENNYVLLNILGSKGIIEPDEWEESRKEVLGRLHEKQEQIAELLENLPQTVDEDRLVDPSDSIH